MPYEQYIVIAGALGRGLVMGFAKELSGWLPLLSSLHTYRKHSTLC